MPNACPFNNIQFLQKIELGQQKSREFMDEIMATVISDLDKPLASNNILSILTYVLSSVIILFI